MLNGNYRFHYSIYFRNNLTDIFQSYLRSSLFPQTPLTTNEGGTGSSNLPMSHLASLLLTADGDETPDAGAGPRSATTGGAPPRSDVESGLITPEEASNITSSDAATVHSSTSGLCSCSHTFYC